MNSKISWKNTAELHTRRKRTKMKIIEYLTDEIMVRRLFAMLILAASIWIALYDSALIALSAAWMAGVLTGDSKRYSRRKK